jgi:hypothetical protein
MDSTHGLPTAWDDQGFYFGLLNIQVLTLLLATRIIQGSCTSESIIPFDATRFCNCNSGINNPDKKYFHFGHLLCWSRLKDA